MSPKTVHFYPIFYLSMAGLLSFGAYLAPYRLLPNPELKEDSQLTPGPGVSPGKHASE